MAIKEKKEEQKSKVVEILTTEYKWETYLLGALSLVAIALGLLIFEEVLTVNANTPLIGNYPKLFAWIIVIVGAIGLVLFAVPLFKPAVPEFKKVTWPTLKVFLGNTTRVFIFIIVIALIFLLYEAFAYALLGFINKTL